MWPALYLLGCPLERTGSDRTRPPSTTTADTAPASSGSTGETGASPAGYPRCGSLDRAVRWSGSGTTEHLAPGPNGTIFAAGNLGSELVLGEEESSPRLYGSCAGFADALLVRMDAEGGVLWSRVARGCGVGSNALDAADGRVAWLTARSRTLAVYPGGANPDVEVREHGLGDQAVAVYTDQGDLLWVGDAGGASGDHPLDVALAPDGSVVVVGYFAISPMTVAPGPGEVVLEPSEKSDTGFTQDDGYLARWNPDGTLAWAQVIGGAGDIDPSTVAVLDDGTIVVVGSFTRSLLLAPGTPEQVQLPALDLTSGSDGFTAAWDADGRLLWAQVWGDRRVENLVRASADIPGGGVVSIGAVGTNAEFGDPPTRWPVDDLSYALARWSPAGQVDSVRSVMSALGTGFFSLSVDPRGWTAAAGLAGTVTFGEPPNTVDLANVVGGADPMVVTWRSDGSEACAWPILSTREDFYERAAAVMFDGQGGLWAAVNFVARLEVVPGTPEALTLTDTTTYGADVLLARFLLEAPGSTSSEP